jgi:hypothetical protein
MAYVNPFYGDQNDTVPTNDHASGPYDAMFGYRGDDWLTSYYNGPVSWMAARETI